MTARKLLFFTVLMFSSIIAAGQDTLPNFSVINPGNDRIIISWTNPYGNTVRQITIQRSFDSLRNYTSILTVPDPAVPQNGYVDTKAATNHMFYRIYLLRDSGRFVFSKSRRPRVDTTSGKQGVLSAGIGEKVRTQIVAMNQVGKLKEEMTRTNERVIYIKNRDQMLGALPEAAIKHFMDSVNLLTKDTLFMKTADTLVIKPFIAREIYRPSKFIFTEKDGNIKIALNEASLKTFSVKFFEEDNTEIFEIKRIRDPLVILDKSNFIHSG